MRAFLKKFFVLILVLTLTSCGLTNTSDEETAKIKVVTSFTILENMVKEIGGEDVEVHNLVPAGTDPHEYEPLPKDLRAIANADILFYNGLNLEGGDEGWLARVVNATDKSMKTGAPIHTVQVTEKVTPMYLGVNTENSEQQSEGQINPHAFTDPNNGLLMVEAILAALQQQKPQNSNDFSARAKAYKQELEELENRYAAEISAIPKEQRILVTSERAFQYLADRYEITEGFLWEIDTEENGSVTQIKELIDFLRQTPVKHLVLESNVDPRPMETVAAETGIPIYEELIFSDEIGATKNGAEKGTYLEYLTHNLEVITSALK